MAANVKEFKRHHTKSTAEMVEIDADGMGTTFSDPIILQNVFRFLCVFCTYLLVVELLSNVFQWGRLANAWMRFTPYCLFMASFTYSARLLVRPDRNKLLLLVFLISVFFYFLLDITKNLSSLMQVPFFGADSMVRKDVQTTFLLAALACFFIGSYCLVVETTQIKSQLRQELEKLQKAEAALRSSEERFRRIFQDGPLGMAMIGPDFRFIKANAAFCRMTGYSESELTALTFQDISHPDNKTSDGEKVRQLFSGELSIYRTEKRYVQKNGGIMWAAVTKAAMPEANQESAYSLAMVEDITERKQIEGQLRHAQKMDAIGRLAGGIAHDFYNILLVIEGHCSLLQKTAKYDGQYLDSLKEIGEAAHRASNLTRQLLMFSRRQVIQVKPLDLNDVLNGLLKMLRRLLGEHIAVEFQGHVDVPWIEADASMMEQIVMNLSVNARDAMPHGGRLSINTCLMEIKAEALPANPEARPGRYVCLTVSDTGCGMNDATLKRLFEPFFTTKAVGQGTGLGLATVYGIVKQHKGWIEVTSQVGRGSTFKVFLPVADTPKPVEDSPPSSVNIRGGQEEILLVEDDPAVRRVIKLGLEVHGYRIFEATKAQEALDLWQRHSQQIKLLLTDLILPEGMNGDELARRLRHEKAGLKVILTSGFGLELVNPETLAKQGITFLAKPHNLNAVAEIVRKCLDEA